MNHRVVAIDTVTKNVLLLGMEAKEMIGKTPEKIVAIRPLKDGVIADYDMTTEMLNISFAKHQKSWVLRSETQCCCCTPSGSTSVERRAIQDAVRNAGAKKVLFD